ncbi:hypothetical protein HYU14_00840 [Candidatus Woesearchaeota archaeon]|nr:hypothetical protein [Candidatus Woesearchaeota archaeon]
MNSHILFNGKRGQLTLFIVIGAVLLIGGAIYFSAREQAARQELQPFTQSLIQEVPSEFAPVQAFVDRCLGQTAREGLQILGEHAGFISLLENNINARDDATNADAVPLARGSEYAIPYWWYLKSGNGCAANCEFSMVPGNKLFLRKTPGKASIEGQLEEYINANINDCLADFREIKAQGFNVSPKRSPRSAVTIYLGQMGIRLDFPLEVTKEAARELSDFLISLPLDFAKVYNTASRLAAMQADMKFLEKHTLNLITAFSGLDRNKLPPFADVRPSFGPKVTWSESQSMERFKNNVLPPNIQLLKVFGAKNYEPYPFFTDPLLDSLYNRGMLIPGTANYSSLEITFEYNPFWNIYFDIDCNGDSCEPETFQENFITGIILQQYNFVYDISFPVKVTIRDTEAFNGEGYLFTFFLEANIRQNDPMPSAYSRIEALQPSGNSQFCDSDKKTSGEITIEAKDSVSEQPIPEVQVIISTGTENCLIGTTDEEGKLVSQFPVAFGPVVSFTKPGFIGYSQRIEPRVDKKQFLSIALNPKVAKSFEIQKRLRTRQPGQKDWEIGSIANLSRYEEATIILTRLSGLQEQDYTTGSAYVVNLTELPTIDIAPGKYEVRIMLLDSRNLSIPQKKIKVKDESFTLPEIGLGEGFKTGGALYNFTFTKYNLQKDKLVFYVLNPDILAIPEPQRTLDDLDELTNVDQASARYWEKLTQGIR